MLTNDLASTLCLQYIDHILIVDSLCRITIIVIVTYCAIYIFTPFLKKFAPF